MSKDKQDEEGRPPQRRDGPDAFQDAPARKPAFSLQPKVDSTPPPRGRLIDPRLVPVVPPEVTTDPARQFHALLGLRAKIDRAGDDLAAIIDSLPPARAGMLRKVLEGENSRLKRALETYLKDPQFLKLEFEAKRRALAAFDLRGG